MYNVTVHNAYEWFVTDSAYVAGLYEGVITDGSVREHPYRPVCMIFRHESRVRNAMTSSLRTGPYDNGRYRRSVNPGDQQHFYQHHHRRGIDVRPTKKARGRNLVRLHCKRQYELVYERADELRVVF